MKPVNLRNELNSRIYKLCVISTYEAVHTNPIYTESYTTLEEGLFASLTRYLLIQSELQVEKDLK